MNAIKKVIDKIMLEIALRKLKISPRGEAALNYYKRIIDGVWVENDYIAAYEKSIKEFCEEKGCTREEAANELYSLLSKLRK